MKIFKLWQLDTNIEFLYHVNKCLLNKVTIYCKNLVILHFFIRLYLIPVIILSFMHITCTHTMFHICQASHDGSFFFANMRLPSKDRLVTSLPTRSYKAISPKIPLSIVQRPTIQHNVPPLRPLHSSCGLLKDKQLVGEYSSTEGDESFGLPGRFSGSKPKCPGTQAAGVGDIGFPPLSRLDSQCKKIHSHSQSQNRILGNHLGHQAQRNGASYRQESKDLNAPGENAKVGKLELEVSGISARDAEFRVHGQPPGTSFLSPITARHAPSLEKLSKDTFSPTQPESIRLPVVEKQYPSNELHLPAGTRDFSINRCLTDRLGLRFGWDALGRLMDTGADDLAHQSEGAVHSIESNTNVRVFTPERSIMLQSDNKTVVAYIRNQGGTRSLVLLNLVKELLLLLDQHNIRLVPFFLPGRYNTIADRLSRSLTLPDWHLSDEILEGIFQKWGKPEVDLFASAQSKIVPRYVSIDAMDREALFTNAFSRPWNVSLAWVFPPPPLIPKVLHHLNTATRIFLLVVPRWEATFWRGDLKSRALYAPLKLMNLENHLVDLSTGLPPQEIKELFLEVWKVRGGVRA
ncbi:uncharacterized protein LOC135162723 isoform X1 [Diachasmimorpha longicaudata]|uniref:uncharacterized protein LOC135162723 isoform X1 n=1 Tax=Diachasmimorpha longicaudata TaxID=58733 RepID=UPI0030B8BBD7